MSSGTEKEEEKPVVAKTAVDLQRLKLMKLMKHPEKPVILPERPKAKNTPTVPEFVRNVMGSSAGAGSGEFHVYRHLRRKEYARQKFIQEKGRKELLDDEYHQKLEQNKKLADEITAKKKAKRVKKKQRQKGKKKFKNTETPDVKGNEDNIRDIDSESDETERESHSSSKNEHSQQCDDTAENIITDKETVNRESTNHESLEQDSNLGNARQTTDADNSAHTTDVDKSNAEHEKRLDAAIDNEKKSNDDEN